MRRQKLHVPADWEGSQPVCEPLSHHYAPQDDTPSKAARNMEGGITVPPHVAWAEEPKDRVYAECRLEKMITRARERHAEEQAQPKGWQPPGA